MSDAPPRPVRRTRNPELEAAKVALAAEFFRNTVTRMNGHPPTEDQVEKGARQIAQGMPPFWDSRTRRYL